MCYIYNEFYLAGFIALTFANVASTYRPKTAALHIFAWERAKRIQTHHRHTTLNDDRKNEEYDL